MINKLPRWIWLGAWVLAFVAGIVNIVGFLGFEHGAVSHLTGTASLLSTSLAASNFYDALHFLLLLGSFLFGAVLSGFIIQDSVLKLGRRYSVALLLEAALLVISVPFLNRGSHLGTYLILTACGLQNAMVSTYSGALIRTTHLTGMFTDLGIFLGHLFRRVPVDLKRIKLCALVITGYLCGGFIGTYLFRYANYFTLYIPAGLISMLALSYGLYTLRVQTKPM